MSQDIYFVQPPPHSHYDNYFTSKLVVIVIMAMWWIVTHKHKIIVFFIDKKLLSVKITYITKPNTTKAVTKTVVYGFFREPVAGANR